jgi:biopolymer transport protein ExbD
VWRWEIVPPFEQRRDVRGPVIRWTLPPESLAWLIAGALVLVAAGAAAAWRITPERDPAYDDATALAGWTARVAKPPASVAVPAGIALPETSFGRIIGRAAPDPRLVTTSTLVLAIAKTGVYLEGRELLSVPADSAFGFDVKFKRSGPSDLFIVPLAAPLAWAREQSRQVELATGQDPRATPLLVLADRDLPYRVITEIVFTAGQSEFGPVGLAGMRDGKVVDLESYVPAAVAKRPDARMPLTVLVTGDGFALRAAGGNVLPDCSGVRRRLATLIAKPSSDYATRMRDELSSPGLAIAKVNGDYDYTALTACLGKLWKSVPEHLYVTVSVDAKVRLQAFVTAHDAVRSALSPGP